MLILLGYLVVLGTVFGGYLMTGGSLGALYQPAELVIIAGAGIGSFIVGNNGKAIKGTLKALPLLFRRSKYTKAMYMDLLALLYTLVRSRSIDYLRHSQSRENYIQEQIEFDDSNRSDYDDYDDILARIMGAIRRFPPQTRRIFTECILHHKSYKEVGELLNISPLTVKTVMARAFKALREQREFFIPAILLLLAGL